MSKKFRFLLFLALITLSACGHKSPKADKLNTIKIGVATPLEGAYRQLGRSIVNATRLAIEERNQKGPIYGSTALSLVVCDDGASEEGALDCAEKFVQEKVVAVIGHLNSQPSISASKIYSQHKIIQISPSATHPSLTDEQGAGGFVFRTCGRDDKQAKMLTETLFQALGSRPNRVSIFNNGTVYGLNLAELIKAEILKRDQNAVIETKVFELEQAQFQKELKDFHSFAIIFIGEYGDAARLLKDLALSNNRDVIFIGADGVFSHKFISEARLIAEGAYVSGASYNQNSTVLEEFKHKFKSKFHMEPVAYALNSYDSTNILIKVLEQEPSLEVSPERLAMRLHKGSYVGLTGTIRFNHKGDPIQSRMCMYRVTNGHFVKI